MFFLTKRELPGSDQSVDLHNWGLISQQLVGWLSGSPQLVSTLCDWGLTSYKNKANEMLTVLVFPMKTKNNIRIIKTKYKKDTNIQKQ